MQIENINTTQYTIAIYDIAMQNLKRVRTTEEHQKEKQNNRTREWNEKLNTKKKKKIKVTF